MQKNDSMNSFGPLVGAIDEGTSSVRFLVSDLMLTKLIMKSKNKQKMSK